MGRVNEGGPAAAAARPVTLERLEEFHAQEYPRLVKFLMVLGATWDEAQDAAQKAMIDFARRLKADKGPDRSPSAYVLRAATNYFIKERKRDLERLPREIKGGHLLVEGHLDERLTHWEDEQYIEQLLECLTSAQRKVIRLVLEGLSTAEIAEALGKSCANVRQQRKNGLDRLRQHPDIVPLAPGKPPDPCLAQQDVSPTTAATPAPRKGEV